MVRIHGTNFVHGEGNPTPPDRNNRKRSPSVFMEKEPSAPSYNYGMLEDAINEEYNALGEQTYEIQLTPQQAQFSRTAKAFEAKNVEKSMFYSSCLPDKGNGNLFDKPARQISGTCTLCAGLNSLKGIPAGENLINNNYTKDNDKGFFAIHLEEADNSSKKNIYIYSEQEVLAAQDIASENSLVSGEGDATALALAFKDYLGDDVFTKKGLALKKFYEIISGQKAFASNEKEQFFTQGITYLDLEKEENNDFSAYFNKIREINKNKKGSTILSVGFNGKDHAISVVGCDKNSDSGEKYLLVQESNFSSKLCSFERYINEEEGFPAFPPTFKISEEDFKSEINEFATIVF